MSESFSTLALVKRSRYTRESSNYPGRSFLDFIVDGVSLYDIIGRRRDLVSTLWFEPEVPAERQKSVHRLLGLEPSDVPGDLVSLYVCPECGDLGCGAVTVKVEMSSTHVIWFDFGYDNTYEDRIHYNDVGPFRFSRENYEHVLKQF